MSEREFNQFRDLFSKNKELLAYFVKLNDYVNFDGYDRKEFHRGRNVHFDDEGYVYFTVEHYTEFCNYELKVHRTNIKLFIPSNDKKSKKLPLYLQDINFKEGLQNKR